MLHVPHSTIFSPGPIPASLVHSIGQHFVSRDTPRSNTRMETVVRLAPHAAAPRGRHKNAFKTNVEGSVRQIPRRPMARPPPSRAGQRPFCTSPCQSCTQPKSTSGESTSTRPHGRTLRSPPLADGRPPRSPNSDILTAGPSSHTSPATKPVKLTLQRSSLTAPSSCHRTC